MAKKTTDVLGQLEQLATEAKAEIDELLEVNAEIDAKAAEAKKPNLEKIKQLNDAIVRLTGKSYHQDAGSAKAKAPGTRTRRDATALAHLATRIHTALGKHKDGLSKAELLEAVPELQPSDNISKLLTDHKLDFSTEGAKKSMRYVGA